MGAERVDPIEQFFPKLEHVMRKARGRTLETVHYALTAILEAIAPSKCGNHLANAGYQST